MTVSYEDIVEACLIVARDENINVCVNESVKGAGITGGATLLGGLLLGPLGLAAGGVFGGLTAYKCCNNFKPLWVELQHLNREDQAKLERHIREIVQKLDITDGIALIALVTSQETIARKLVYEALMTFARQIA